MAQDDAPLDYRHRALPRRGRLSLRRADVPRPPERAAPSIARRSSGATRCKTTSPPWADPTRSCASAWAIACAPCSVRPEVERVRGSRSPGPSRRAGASAVTVRSSAPGSTGSRGSSSRAQSTGQHLGELPRLPPLLRVARRRGPAPGHHPPPRPRGGQDPLRPRPAAGGAVPAAEHQAALRRAATEGIACFDPRRDALADVSLASPRATRSEEQPPSRCSTCSATAAASGCKRRVVRPRLDAPSGGAPALVDAGALRRVLEPHRRTLRLVVLSACYGGDAGAPGNALGAVAQELHRIGIPAVIASRQPLSVPGSIALTEDAPTASSSSSSPRSRTPSSPPAQSSSSTPRAATGPRSSSTRRPPAEVTRGRSWCARTVASSPSATQHKRFFFGRDAVVAEVTGNLAALGEAGRPRFLMVAGASGTGKSSLVLAGVVPRLTEAPGARWEGRLHSGPAAGSGGGARRGAGAAQGPGAAAAPRGRSARGGVPPRPPPSRRAGASSRASGRSRATRDRAST